MKTIRECLNELPEPYRTEALENIDILIHESETEKSVDEALQSEFFWAASPQGHDYWEKFHATLLPNPIKPKNDEHHRLLY